MQSITIDEVFGMMSRHSGFYGFLKIGVLILLVVHETALSSLNATIIGRRQMEPLRSTLPATKSGIGGALGDQNRFTKPTTTMKALKRTTAARVSFEENCDYLAYYCLKAYDTGQLCGRSLYYTYYTFKNYCMLDFVNCMERYEIWQVVHMGECFNVTVLTEYLLYPYDDDFFLDQYYIIEDH